MQKQDIAIQILKPVYDNDDDGEDIIQSKIMYTVYPRSSRLKEYLIAALSFRRLRIYDSTMRRYHITEKGIQFLDIWHNMSDIADELGRQTWVKGK